MENIQKIFPDIEKKNLYLLFKEWTVAELSFIVGNFKDWVGDEAENSGQEKDELYKLLVDFEEKLNCLYTRYYDERKEVIKSESCLEPNMTDRVMSLHNSIGSISDWIDNIDPVDVVYFTEMDEKTTDKFEKQLRKIGNNITKLHAKLIEEKDKLIEIYTEIYKIDIKNR